MELSRSSEHRKERGLRAVYCDFSSPSSQLLARAHLASLYNRRLQDIAILMFKVKHRLLSVNIINIFRNSPSHYNLSNSDFFIQRYNTVRGHTSVKITY